MAFYPPNHSTVRDPERFDACPPLPPRRYGNSYGPPPYVHSTDTQVSSAYANAMIPGGPAPPYYDYDAYGRDKYEEGAEMRTASSRVLGKVKKSSYRKEQDRERGVNLLGRPIPIVFVDCPVVRSMNQSAALCDRVAVKVNDVLSRLDSDDYGYHDMLDKIKEVSLKESKTESKTEDQTRGLVDFQKTWLYANSRLRPGLLPMKLYIPTWQVVCMAAEASLDVYRRPQKGAKEDYVEADWRQGTKTMVVNSRRTDEQNLIVIAIRGSKWNLVDWAVNFRPAPSEPVGFLDDAGNACHAGFLQVARAMVAPIAARLRHMLETDPSRASCSLLLTGHSAGGAVASLLYMHMISVTLESELNILTGCFKRIHCVTFGAPPVTFLPLQHPARSKNIFLAFANEGDCVVRANKAYISTLVKIIAAPSPPASSRSGDAKLAPPKQGLRERISRAKLNSGAPPGDRYKPTWWEIPPATLSNAGRIVLLREKPFNRPEIEAVQVTDEELRDVIFGDPAMHAMELYKSRVDRLAVAAVTGRPAG